MQQVLTRMLSWRMLGGAGLALLVTAGGAVASDSSEPVRDLPTTTPLATLGTHPASLTRVDPLTLKPQGPRVNVGLEYKGVYSFAPDGSAVAFGRTVASPPVRGFGIRVIDTQNLSVVADVPTEVYGGALAWLEPRRLVAVLGREFGGSCAAPPCSAEPVDPGHLPAIVVDPLTGEELTRERLPIGNIDQHCAAIQAGDEALIVTGRRSLFVIRANGTFDTVRLPREFARCGDVTASPSGGSAFAVSAGGDRVVEVALTSGKSVVHRLGSAVRGSLEAIALDRRRVVIAQRGPNDQPRGVSIVDVNRERRERIDSRAGDARVVAGRILTFATGADVGSGDNGVRGYARNGERKFAVLGGSRLAALEPSDHFAYALTKKGVTIIDANAGTVVDRSSSRTPIRPGGLLQREGPFATEAEG